MVFCWLSTEDIPERLDLRGQGWALARPDSTGACVTIIHAPGIDDIGWMQLASIARPESRRTMLVADVNAASSRTRLLAEGFGDVVDDDVSLPELSARARRLEKLAQWLPKRRVLGGLELDLMGRDAFYRGEPLKLVRREFDLLWRLADSPYEDVGRDVLVRDVWRIGFVPESNSIAVHMSRLRGKLAAVGLEGALQTGLAGYRLCLPDLDCAVPTFWRQDYRDTRPAATIPEPVGRHSHRPRLSHGEKRRGASGPSSRISEDPGAGPRDRRGC